MSAIRPYGAWPSLLSARAVAGASVRLGQVVVDGQDVYWLEGRPAEGGRSIVVKRDSDGGVLDVTPSASNVRTRVYEYGGAAYAVSRGVVYYTEFSDQRVYRLEPGQAPEALTASGPWRYADFGIDPVRARLVCVREEHDVAALVSVSSAPNLPTAGPVGPGEVIAAGDDFYSTPRFSPDGSQLAWLSWRHPQMPWEGTVLWLAAVDSGGGIGVPSVVAGARNESVFQPGWSLSGELYFVSDRTGWWNLYCLRDGMVRPVATTSMECGRPQWLLGTATWAPQDSSHFAIACADRGRWHLGRLDLRLGTIALVPTNLEPGETLAATRTDAITVGGSPTNGGAIVRIDLSTGGVAGLRTAGAAPLAADAISIAEPIEFPTDHGLTAHAFYYAPKNPEFSAPAGELPPLLVIAHGGPTSQTTTWMNVEIQYWTTRGFAVVDVNYGGSTGYGRPYRERLNGQWGVVDVADCVNAAQYLVREGKADANRLVIRGRSAGGYTTLAALAFRPGVFKAGASYYGIGDLEPFVRDTHKFESRYLDSLIGPYPASRDLYRSRSPINFVDQLSCPVIFFQGLEDRVVPPEQSRLMYDAVRAKGLRSELVTFEGEQHGFRKADTIVRCLEVELSFYREIFGIT